MSKTSPPPTLGPLIRLNPLPLTNLPSHPDLSSQQQSAAPPDLQRFITTAFNEALTFSSSYIPHHFSVKNRSKTSPPSHAAVQLLTHDIPASEIPDKAKPAKGDAVPESWFARTSLHENKAEQGTAAWEEFERGLLREHSEREAEYTPNVYDAHKVLGWDVQLARMNGRAGPWGDVGMGIYEMAHSTPWPTQNRVFSVLVLTGKTATPTGEQFLVVQIPVDVSTLPKALYSNGRNKKAGDTAQKKKGVTMGIYTSVEHCELKGDIGEVKWQMATTSDAKGMLPMWMQKMGVAGAVVKDVGLFIDWTNKNRKNGEA